MSSPKPLSKQEIITPPGSYVNSPLTPPPTDDRRFWPHAVGVLHHFRNRRKGKSDFITEPWTRIQLAQGEFEEIQRQLDEDKALSGFVDDKIRYDYFAHLRRLVIRMPASKLHERFSSAVTADIIRQLETIRQGSKSAARFAQSVEHVGSATIFPVTGDAELSGERHDPDISFQHVDAAYPGVVIEVSYSQKRRDLPHLADDYLLDSNGSIQVMIGLDIEYRGSQKATVSMWRPQYVMNGDQEELRAVQTVQDEVFRDEDGLPSNGPGLEFQLRDFTNPELAGDLDQNPTISISAQQLCLYLADAERFQGGLIRSQRSRHTIKPGAVKRKRAETPPEKITSGDEARIIDEEERAAKRAALDDQDYKPSPTESSFTS